MKHIMKCPKCGQYTMKEKCPKCDTETTNPKPAKYSPEDNYGKYRREAKKEELQKRGLL